MKILNLYAGLGGNRKHWSGHDITAVEYTDDIAEQYAESYPNDKVVIADAHQYLLQHYKEFDFVWSSPPCQSHSRMIRSGKNRKPRYPDMKLYEEILFLKHNFDGLWVVENVVPYYGELISAKRLGRHLFWSNFEIQDHSPPEYKGFINKTNLEGKEALIKWLGIKCDKNIYYEGNHCPAQVLRNCVHPDTGLFVLQQAEKTYER